MVEKGVVGGAGVALVAVPAAAVGEAGAENVDVALAEVGFEHGFDDEGAQEENKGVRALEEV